MTHRKHRTLPKRDVAPMPNLKLIAGIVLLIVFMTTNFFSYQYGKSGEKLKISQASVKFQQREDELLQKLQKTTAKREVVYRDRIKVITDTKGDCIHTDIPEPLRSSLHNDSPR